MGIKLNEIKWEIYNFALTMLLEIYKKYNSTLFRTSIKYNSVPHANSYLTKKQQLGLLVL